MKKRFKIHSEKAVLAPDSTPFPKKSDPWYEILANYGAISARDAFHYAKELEEQSADLYAYAIEKNPKLKRPAPPKNIPKTHFLLCMARSEQDEARKLAKKCCLDLSFFIRSAIRQMIQDMREEARINHLTGMDHADQCRFFGFKAGEN